jgi:protein gp37
MGLMGDKSAIESTDATWNPVTGCTEVSAGCDHCYARTLAERLQKMGNPKYRDGFAVRLHESALYLPLRWEKPRRVFVNSMSDAFHVDVPRDFLDTMFTVMLMSPRHTFQVLTKRPQRAANYLNQRGERYAVQPWPIRNVWIGTSVEDARVVHRIRALRRAPAAVRFLSLEPLLGPLPNLPLDGIGWVIAGGESGRGHRPIEADWVRDIRDQCQRAGVPFFFKQWGGLTPKSGGRLLDGREWSEFPTARVTT